MLININGEDFDTEVIVRLKDVLALNEDFSIFPSTYPIPDGLNKEDIESSILKKYKNKEVIYIKDLTDSENISYFLDDISSSVYEGMKKFTTSYNYLLSEPEFIEQYENIKTDIERLHGNSSIKTQTSTKLNTGTVGNSGTQTQNNTKLNTGTVGNTTSSNTNVEVTANNELLNTMTDNTDRYSVNEELVSGSSPFTINGPINNPSNRTIEKINNTSSATKGTGTTTQSTFDVNTTTSNVINDLSETNALTDATSNTQTNNLTESNSLNDSTIDSANDTDKSESIKRAYNKAMWELIDDYCNSKSLNPWSQLYSELDYFFMKYKKIRIEV